MLCAKRWSTRKQEVILNEVKNPEGDGCVITASLLWILRFAQNDKHCELTCK